MGVELVKAAMVYGKALSGNGSGGDEHALYRFFGEGDELLYIGISIQPFARMGQHQGDKSWWGEVVKVTIERRPDRSQALAAEKAAIKAEKPRYNVVHARPAKQPRPKIWLTYTYWEPSVGGVVSVPNVMPISFGALWLRCGDCGMNFIASDVTDHGGEDFDIYGTCTCGSGVIRSLPRRHPRGVEHLSEQFPYPLIRRKGGS